MDAQMCARVVTCPDTCIMIAYMPKHMHIYMYMYVCVFV